MADPEIMSSPTILAKAMGALDGCKAHPNELLAWWKKLTEAGAKVSAKALRSLLAQTLNRGRSDTRSLHKVVEISLNLPAPREEMMIMCGLS